LFKSYRIIDDMLLEGESHSKGLSFLTFNVRHRH